MEGYINFNLNHYVKVKLKEKGYQHLANEHNKWLGKIPNLEKRTAEYYKKDVDAEGYSKFQAWVFFETFQNRFGFNEVGQMFDINIKIQHNENT